MVAEGGVRRRRFGVLGTYGAVERAQQTNQLLVLWGLVDWVPFAGWSTDTSLMLSRVVLLGLLVWSYRRVHARSGR